MVEYLKKKLLFIKQKCKTSVNKIKIIVLIILVKIVKNKNR